MTTSGPKIPGESRQSELERLRRRVAELEVQQQKTKESERRLRSFFDNAPVGKSMTAPDGTLLRVNAAFGAMLGYSLEEMQRTSFAEITHPEDVTQSQECLRCLLDGERSDWRMEKRYLHRDGRVVWTDVTTRLQRGEDGEPRFFLTHVIDITDKKAASEALRERVKELSCLQGLSAIVERAGDSLETILEQTTRLLPASWMYSELAVARIRLDEQEHKTGEIEECEAVQRAEIRVLKEVRGAVEVGYLEPRPARDEGPFLWEERALLDALTERLGHVIDRLETKAALEASEERFRRLAENAPDVIYRMSLPDGAYEYVSPAAERMFGHPPEAFLERPLLVKEMLHPDYHDYFRQAWERLLAGEAPPTYQYAIIDGAGRTRHMNQRNVLLRDDEGRPRAIEGVVTDVTESVNLQRTLEALNQDLERSNQDLEQFAYVVSHDLQEPLRMVSSYTQLLARRYGDRLDQDAREFIDYAVDGATRMQGLINDLLAFSRVGTRARPFEAVDCAALLEQTKRDLEPAIEESGAQVTAGPLPVVRADPTQLAQVFRNLLSNALKFRGDAPCRVTISAERTKEHWAVSFEDNGIGIDPEHNERVFEVFQRLHGRGKYPGTGIGLAIVKKVVARHGGEVRLRSAPGDGACVTFTLPAAEDIATSPTPARPFGDSP